MHISKRALTFDGTIYSLKTDLSFKMELPKAYFGEKEDDDEEQVFNGD